MAHKLHYCVLALVLGCFFQLSAAQKGLQIYPPAAKPPAAVLAEMGSRKTRLMHNLFHNIRMNWALLDELEQKQIADLGWKPAYVSFTYKDHDINQPVTLYNANGEDFLYMHREMIAKVNKLGSPSWQVDGWTDCPLPTDTTVWPVPEVPEVGNDAYAAYLQSYKTPEFYANTIKPAEDWLKDDNNLKTLTLGELGVKLEYEVHTYMHVRFSAYNPVGYRMQSLHPTAHIDTMWDDLRYDYLADFYSAHVNPTFWKIHGWIEKKITAWADANFGVGTQLKITQWSSTWESGPLDDAIIEALDQVAADAEWRASHDSDDTDAGKIVGSVFGGLVAGFLIALVGFYCMLKMQQKKYGNAKPSHTHENKPLKGGHTQANQDEQVEIGKK